MARRILIDDKIPFIKGVFEPFAEVEYLPGGLVPPGKPLDAEALIIRTRTLCNEETLYGAPVRFIATATIGYDHIDTDYCRQHDIVWTNAPGCNADSVAMYIGCVLKALALKHHFSLQDKTLGIVGLGHVGERVAKLSQTLGCRVLKNDPPKEKAIQNVFSARGVASSDKDFPKQGKTADEIGNPEAYVSLDTLIQESDIITLHPLLTMEGDFPSYHLFDEKRLAQMRPHQYLINASRGEVVDNQALKIALQDHKIKGAVLDVWENEPNIDKELLSLLDIATPHIAGYGIDGKANGTEMSVRAVARFLGIEALYDWTIQNLPTSLPAYNVWKDDEVLRYAPENFEVLRTQAEITKVNSKTISW